MAAEKTPARQPRDRDLTSGSLHRAIWYLALPMMLETGIMNVAQVLDTYWVGQLGSAALAAVTGRQQNTPPGRQFCWAWSCRWH